MSAFVSMVVLVLVSAGLGAVGLSLLTLLVHWLCVPQAITDGLYSTIFVVTVPSGALLGIASGIGIYFTFEPKPVIAGWSCVSGGAFVLVAAFLFLLLILSDEHKLPDALIQFCLWFGLPSLWAAALLIRGLLFLKSV